MPTMMFLLTTFIVVRLARGIRWRVACITLLTAVHQVACILRRENVAHLDPVHTGRGRIHLWQSVRRFFRLVSCPPVVVTALGLH